MSRSFKHTPMAAICGTGSAHQDKTMAARSVRRAHRQAIHNAIRTQELDVLLPHRLECSHNETYCWVRDGSQRWCGLGAKERQKFVEATTPGVYSRWGIMDYYHGDEDYMQWPPLWYQRMMRK